MSKNIRVLFIDSVHPVLNHSLESAGMECIDATQWSEQEIHNAAGTFNGVVIRSRIKLDKSFLEKNQELHFIARAGAGMENIDYRTAESLGISCFNAPEGNRNAVAEHALGMLLALLNNLITAHKEVCNGVWLREKNRGTELDGKTVGIIGFGNTGKSFAKKLSGFKVRILVYDPYQKINTAKYPYVEQVLMDTIFDQCDILSLHIPLTAETAALVNPVFIQKFKKQFYLLNTSRGRVVMTDSLVEALKTGKVKGAALDVLDFESLSFENLSFDKLPNTFRELVTFSNVVLSPHIAGWTHESHLKISEILAKKIIDFYASL